MQLGQCVIFELITIFFASSKVTLIIFIFSSASQKLNPLAKYNFAFEFIIPVNGFTSHKSTQVLAVIHTSSFSSLLAASNSHSHLSIHQLTTSILFFSIAYLYSSVK
ncbi:MAG: hypothetical protein LBC61_00270 [Candidatus Peribacteria bacterium]|jgi:hypothetical protein|nr:hypothetical protein [Candidatus Peribacteria bacterium]